MIISTTVAQGILAADACTRTRVHICRNLFLNLWLEPDWLHGCAVMVILPPMPPANAGIDVPKCSIYHKYSTLEVQRSFGMANRTNHRPLPIMAWNRTAAATAVFNLMRYRTSLPLDIYMN